MLFHNHYSGISGAISEWVVSCMSKRSLELMEDYRKGTVHGKKKSFSSFPCSTYVVVISFFFSLQTADTVPLLSLVMTEILSV